MIGERELNADERSRVEAIKAVASGLHALLAAESNQQDMHFGPGAPPSSITIARQKLAECVFWAVHSITG